ncbi:MULTISPECIES: DNA polymerase III subunit gamma/tau [unclassified Fusibacter]|uniref:DNA polymerase III subunit gamma/tau n=1 Tax=unclassified Fusibacter TaxID=2624464 RepID=UPI0013E94340|nr:MULTISPECIES: DNA polymerase III subunit gamma/tau [unclassified Fusibacter]MCK8060864.1 DNA polymerase III subunit gamma/tau [Fusibacter sp. A2]NPE23160.1 DNA polymerase III subunit gamma/tau [Fusibacter sp. A1]
MEYKALYRRFRPLTFGDVIGQQMITQTLINQIAHESIGHAYLFTGSRGTGKTTTSKILSRVVNCLNPVDHNPCNQCEVCRSILNDSNMDVVEMDAASNNGVDDIRELRENIKFPPSSSRYKVMIIDEVHMLSKGAFNALLKTLEEPPEYMIFILATTEPHKVPATITSRCQRFEFKRIDASAMREYMHTLCTTLEVKVDDDALKLIVRLSEGAMRDALSLLEQCLSFAGEVLTYEIAASVLGRSNDDDLTILSEAIIRGDVSEMIRLSRIQYDRGKDVSVLIGDLIELFRSGMLFSTMGDDHLMDLPQSELVWIERLTSQHGVKEWIRVLEALMVADQKVRYASHPWIAFELALAKLTAVGEEDSIAGLIKRIENLERNGVQAIHQPVRDNQRTVQQAKVVEVSHDKAVPRQADHGAAETEAEVFDPGDLTLLVIKENWDKYMSSVKERLVSTYALMKEVKPVSFKNGKLQLQLNEALKILKPAIENEDNMFHICEAFKHTFGSLPKIEIIDYALEDTRADEVKSFFKNLVDDDHVIIK